MHIVMFSINPLFPSQVMGGAPKHLQNIALHLGEQGHRVTVLCTTPPQNDAAPFYWHENVTVKPVLPFKQPFPQPYDIPVYDLAAIVQTVGDALMTADRFYMHDGEFLFPYVYQRVPTVVSLRDNVYPETNHGSFLFQADKMVLISDYSRRVVEATAGRFFPRLHERITVIPNGLDWNRFKPTPPDEILRYVPVNPETDDIILHPHRPEESKGIMQTVAVVDRLVNQYGLTHIKALIPKWIHTQLTAELRAFYERVEAEIHTRGLNSHIVLHDWIPQHLMPQYFSLGRVTFSLGHFVESFGNAVYESLGCGTPSIAARISTHRELLPDTLLDKVDFDDADAAAARAADIIRESRRTSPQTLAYLHEHYSVRQQLAAYADTILNAQAAASLAYQHPRIDDLTPYKLAPWCYQSASGRIYHDFRAEYRSLGAVMDLLNQYPNGISIAQAKTHAIDRAEILELYRLGYLVPV